MGAESVDTIIDNLKKMVNETKELEPYIRYIRFPFFKTLEPGTKMDFEFPMTVLIGPNGTNKTSVLRALQGSPGQNSIGQYWFSTDVDRIKESRENADEIERHCFIYGYKIPCGDGRIVEVLKTRIGKKEDPDYWEPSRPVRKYDMERELPPEDEYRKYRSATRWNAIDKEVLYIDFRENLCAFDKYFYFGRFRSLATLPSKQARVRLWSTPLREAADGNKNSLVWGNGPNPQSRKERIKRNVLLGKEAVGIVSDILGRKYLQIRLITHTFFDSTEGTSVLLTDEQNNYSEAFAGSGESALIMTVAAVYGAPKNSLILLDEPETSLHPAAQTKLRDYLLKEIQQKHHQVVLSTHSPAFAKGLPEEALKIFTLNGNGKVHVRNRACYQEAFHVVGAPNMDRKTVYVEDALAAALLEYVLENRRPDSRDALEIVPLSGGAERILQGSFVGNAISGQKNTFYILDGDKRYVDTFPDPNDLAPNEYRETVEKAFKMKTDSLRLPFHSGEQERQLQKFLSLILDYLHKDHLQYFPGNSTPETLILKHSGVLSRNNGKASLLQLAKERYNKEHIDANEILQCGKMLIGEISKSENDSLFSKIEQLLKKILEK